MITRLKLTRRESKAYRGKIVQKKSVSTSVLVGVSLLFLVVLGMGGIAYSFYRTEIAEEIEESADMANDDSPFEQLKKEKNMVIVPVPEENGGSGGTNFNTEGIPTGTYSNPPSNITSTSSSYSTETNRPIDDSNSSVYSNSQSSRRSLVDPLPNYSSSSSSSNFNRTSNNSLIEPLDSSDFLDVPSNDRNQPIETPALGESSF